VIGAEVIPPLGPDSGLGVPFAPSRTPRADAWRRFKKNKLAIAGLIILGLIVLLALFAPLITKYDPTSYPRINVQYKAGPSSEHWFGTDNFGRDVFSRVIYGARVSLFIGLLATLLETVIGVAVGAIAGWYGGATDQVLMRIVDILLAIPYIILAIVLVGAIGRGIEAVIITLGVTAWLGTARVLRAGFLQTKNREYVDAARAMGCSDFRIVWRHLLPNTMQPIIVYAALDIGSAILAEAALSFLGVGVQEPTPSWGLMIDKGQDFFGEAWWLLVFPAIFLFLTVLSFVLIADGLSDAFDTKQVV
jgi:ABC-type dipeptide/oligopeptide/nickel transport system permease subunit